MFYSVLGHGHSHAATPHGEHETKGHNEHENEEHHHEGGEGEGVHGEDEGHSSSPILNFVVKRLQVELATPENVFIEQDDMPVEDKMFIYFIAKGGCEVIVKDRISEGFEESKPKGL